MTAGRLKTWLTAALLATTCLAANPRLQLKDGWYYLDGRKFLINALGYESGARPGQTPYGSQVRDLAQVRRDLKLIKAAGFNGIRTWAEMSEAELKVVQASGLKIIFGIWLKPDDDFSDPAVVARDLAVIRKVLAYSRNYSCVITYLIMNEPMPEHLRKVGAQATRDLWARAVELIHQLHPGIPVTISGNSAITEWVDLNLFDVYGRNAYDYNEGANFTHGYATAQRALTDSYGGSKPALLTEFGRSVSRRGSEGYGGNTLQQQADAMVKYYRDLLDAGVTGLCPFYFADGWWKGGEPAIHNDEAEEWFGFYGFKDLKDTTGRPRPAWHALTRYNQALVTSPGNHAFYQVEVPVEAFCQPAVRKLRVLYHDGVLLEAVPDAHGQVHARLAFPGEALTDRELVFESLDARGRLLKSEVLIVLTGPEPIQWPTLELQTPVTDLAAVKAVPIELRVANPTVFTLGGEVRYAFSPHQGWDRAATRTRPLAPGLQAQTVTDSYTVPAPCVMLAVYAGVDIRFGKFVRTLHAERYLYPGTWADPLRLP
jgi:hypothetical protein